MSSSTAVSIVVPASNLSKNISQTLDLLVASVAPIGTFEIMVVVNDALPGPVVGDVRRYAFSTGAPVTVISLPDRDKASAVKLGFARARGEIWGFSDADLGWQARADEIREMVGRLKAGECDLVTAHRDQSEWTTVRKLKTNVFRFLGRVLFRHGIVDSQAPLKFMTADVGRAVMDACAFRGWEFDVEMLWWARQFGYRIEPHTVHWKTEGTETTIETLALGLVLMGPSMVFNLLYLRVRAWWLQQNLVRKHRVVRA